VRTHIATLAVALAFASIGAGCSPFYRWLPYTNELTLASIGEPIRAIEAPKDMATVIIAQRGGYDGGKKAFTYVLEDATFLGQSTTRSYFVAEIPPGKHTLIRGLPEFGPDAGCSGERADFVAGKVYVYEDIGFTPAKDAVRDLSLDTYLEVDAATGQEAVRRQMDAYWTACIEGANKQADANEAEPSAFALKRAKAGEVAVDVVNVPAPP